MKTADLIGPALDWAVAKCEGYTLTADGISKLLERGQELFRILGPGASHLNYSPSTDWAQGGPIIEREGITVSKEDGQWSAYFRDKLFEDDGSEHWQVATTPLIAAMRCFVASKLGAEVDVPKELA